MTLACEDANSKLVAVVIVVDDIDAEKRVDNNLVQIWKLKFGLNVKYGTFVANVTNNFSFQICTKLS